MAVQTTIYTAGGTPQRTYLNKEFYDKNLLEMAKTKFVHANFGQKRNIPRNGGKKVEFRRWVPFTITNNYNELTEGVTPDGQDLAQTHLEATCKQYGAYVEVSDLLKRTSYDDVALGATDMLGEQMGTIIEWVTRDAMCAGTNVLYANGKTARTGIDATDKLTTTEIRKAVRELKKAKAPMITEGKKPHYVAIISPDAAYDLQSDPLWQDVSKYSNAEQIYSGEIGRLFGVVFVESTEAKVFTGGGASGADVHCALVFGRDAYGRVDIEGSGAIESIVKSLGQTGYDPLNQRATYGAKVEAYTALILNDDWLIRIEHGVTA